MDSSDDFDDLDEYDDDSFDEGVGLEVESAKVKDPTDWRELGSDGDPENKYPFRVLSQDRILKLMNDYICEGNSILQLHPTTVRLLFNHFRWDKQKLLEAYFDRDHGELFREAKIGMITAVGPTPPGASGKNGAHADCAICLTEVPSSNMYGMECGHRFCLQCWEYYLRGKIIDEGKGEGIACAALKCSIYMDDVTVMTLVTDEEVKLKYRRWITNSFVQCNPLLSWCTFPGCANAIQVKTVDSRPVKCDCGHKFCFRCGKTWHAPVNCDWLRKWEKKTSDDSMTFKWVAANTKGCPKCKVDIEKNGGCNHMRCTSINCGHEFCWICLLPWGGHGYEACNRYDASKVDAETARVHNKSIWKRYIFYYDRFMGQLQSLKLEGALGAKVQAKMEEMQLTNMTWVEVQFLQKAVDVLRDCRETLMYTYVFGYYLKATNQAVIFENNQKDLQNSTEILSGYLERDVFTTEGFAEIRRKVNDKYRYCEGRRKILLEHVREGYEKDEWVWNEEELMTSGAPAVKPDL